jgi:DNA-binding CsgD family transcriptional regulator
MDERFVTAVKEIYATSLQPSHWPQALQAIADCFGDVGTILIFSKDDGSFGVLVSPRLKECAAEYARDWSRRDTRANRGLERNYFINRDVITDRDVIDEAEMERDPFYNDLLRRHGLKYFACAMVSPDPHVAVGLSVQRSLDKPPYSDAELALMKELGTHVECALRLSIRLMNADLINMGLGSALARIGIGVFVLDGLQRVVFSNPSAQGLLGDGLHVVKGRLIPASAEGRSAVEQAIRSVVEGKYEDKAAAPKPILIPRQHSGRPLAIYIMPISPAGDGAEQFLASAQSVVLAVDPEADAPPEPAVVRDILGLTLSEARVASLVGFGIPPREAAAKLGISEETTRTALKRVFSKIGVSRQSELAALMTRLVLR